MMKSLLVFLLFSGLPAGALTELPKHEKIWSTRDARWLTLSEMPLAAGDVVVLGEQHAVGDSPSERVHHSNQYRLMTEIGRMHRVSLGMEFFAYPKQDLVDQYVYGNVAESDFLQQIGWGGNAFPLYRDQVELPGASGGRTYAINMPRSVTAKVSRGIPLTPEEQNLLPPLWERGAPEYFARFSATMKGHVSDDQIEKFFMAQSLWDDTMAWQVGQAHRAGDDEVYVILVGEFHVEYGHGLPARLAKHGVGQVKTIVQTEVTDWSEAALAEAVAPHPTYGARADYIWVYQLN